MTEADPGYVLRQTFTAQVAVEFTSLDDPEFEQSRTVVWTAAPRPSAINEGDAPSVAIDGFFALEPFDLDNASTIDDEYAEYQDLRPYSLECDGEQVRSGYQVVGSLLTEAELQGFDLEFGASVEEARAYFDDTDGNYAGPGCPQGGARWFIGIGEVPFFDGPCDVDADCPDGAPCLDGICGPP